MVMASRPRCSNSCLAAARISRVRNAVTSSFLVALGEAGIFY